MSHTCATNGDLFCRECAVSNLLAQRKEIKRLEKEWEREKAELEDADLRREAEAKENELTEFENTMAGFGEKRKRLDFESNTAGRDKRRRASGTDQDMSMGSTGSEKSSKQSSQSFWVPGLTPSSGNQTPIHSKPPKMNPVCPASKVESPHHYSLKSLVEVNFTLESDSTKGPTAICPSCKKSLTNASKAVLTKPCGHVLCKPCVTKFMKPAEGPDPHAKIIEVSDSDVGRILCYVCETDVTELYADATGDKEGRKARKDKGEKEKVKPGLVEINTEGTGFAAGGNNMAKKEGVAFQC
ncbi:putative ring finger domain-containing protein [Phaeomoniella chlamydospora]|uniref:Putative ring finger domain-containing protein n=1 Tax=Phaeomoniella chlamydospora TaxID=158046 RepID=A0A0G2EEZ6_PHACM|nr:putative ring finger domain-containing protein [Phaeomoniella chlamydospora]